MPVWNGRPLYQSYLIADAGRNATSIDALAGDIHAFSDPDSNSGYLVTAAELAGKGYKPERFFRQVFFTYGHRNVVRAVASGLAQSGSVDGYVYEVLREVEPALVGATRWCGARTGSDSRRSPVPRPRSAPSGPRSSGARFSPCTRATLGRRGACGAPPRCLRGGAGFALRAGRGQPRAGAGARDDRRSHPFPSRPDHRQGAGGRRAADGGDRRRSHRSGCSAGSLRSRSGISAISPMPISTDWPRR